MILIILEILHIQTYVYILKLLVFQSKTLKFEFLLHLLPVCLNYD